MLSDEENALLLLLKNSMLPGQDGIKIRAFLAFNRGNDLAKLENLENLQKKEVVLIKDETVYPIEAI
jgi:hypothetical protein